MSDVQDIGNDEMANGIIDNIYKSMSKIIEAINKDNSIINQQVKRIREELEIVCKTVAELKDTNIEIINIHTAELSSIMEQIEEISNNKKNGTVETELENIKLSVDELNKEMENIRNKNNNDLEIHRQILETRTSILNIMDTNTKNIKKEIDEIKDIKKNLNTYIKSIAYEEYTNNVNEIKKEFEELKKEHRIFISQLIRNYKK